MRLTLFSAVTLLAIGCEPPKIPDLSLDDDTGPPTPTDTGDPPICPANLDPVIESAAGCVWGSSDGDVESFLGIPYAAPPVDELRFLAPRAADPWDEPFAAGSSGSPCIQTFDSKDGALADGEGDEDCLTLNVWRPAGAEGLPIVFFVHGGRFLNGAGTVTDLAGRASLPENAVVVTHNYRLGPFGYLAHPALTRGSRHEASGNQGVLDSLMALEWVVENAVALGGDPSEIVLVGQEAGGLQACALLMSPLSEGLISAAVLQSAGCGWLERPMSAGFDEARSGGPTTGEEVGEALAAALSCSGTDAEVLSCLQGSTAYKISTALPARPALLMDDEGAPWEPIVDGYVLPASVRELVRAGEVPDIPVFAGVNRDEGTLFAEEIDASAVSPFTLDVTINHTLEDYGEEGAALPTGTFDPEVWGDAPAAFAAFYGYATVICPTRTFLRALREQRAGVYAYTFTHPPSFADPTLGVYTGAELPFVFGTHRSEYSAREDALSTQLQAAWLWTLESEPWVLDLGAWPDFWDDTWVEFGDDDLPHAVTDPYGELCDALDDAGWQVW